MCQHNINYRLVATRTPFCWQFSTPDAGVQICLHPDTLSLDCITQRYIRWQSTPSKYISSAQPNYWDANSPACKSYLSTGCAFPACQQNGCAETSQKVILHSALSICDYLSGIEEQTTRKSPKQKLCLGSEKQNVHKSPKQKMLLGSEE